MSRPIWLIGEKNICKTCRNAKDRYKEACFCTQYGIIVSYGKTNCKGYDPYTKKTEEKENE